jgi:glycosyltransferase involved in cell wall biosynthesis
MRKKILIIAPFYPPNIGGAETFAENLVREMVKEFDVTVLAYMPFDGHEAWPYEEIGNLKIYRINWPFKPPKIWAGIGVKNLILAFPNLLKMAIRLQNQNKFEICFGHGLISSAVGGLLRLFGVKVSFSILLALYDFRGFKPHKKAIFRLFLKGCSKIYAEGQNGKKDLLDLGIKEDRIVIYQHWCDQSKYKPGMPHFGKMVVLCAGRLSLAEKGIHIIKDVERRMVGMGVQFVFAQNVTHSDMPKLYQMADVVVIPSVYSEGIPLVSVESASSGCALVVTDKGTLPEQVKDYGAIVNEPYPENFEIVLIELANNELMLANMKQMTLDYARKYYSPKNAEVFLEVCR